MIVVRVELWKRGNPKDVESLGLLTIANTGGTTTRGSYKYTLYKRGAKLVVWKTGHISGFKRKQYQVWYLIYGILRQMFTLINLESAFDDIPSTPTATSAPATPATPSSSRSG